MGEVLAEVDKLLAGDSLTAEQQTKHDALTAEFNALENTANQIKAQIARSENLETVPPENQFRLAFDLSPGEEKDLSKFSLLKVHNAVANGRSPDGLEGEMAALAMTEASRSGAQIQGVGVPIVALAALRNRFRNDMTATGGSNGNQGGTMIATDLRGLIAPLYSKTVLASLGASILTGLVGNISIPTIADTTEQTEKSENADADEVSAATGSVSLTPHRLPVVMDLSKQLLIQSSTDVEAFVNRHLITKAGIRIDRMAIHGSNASNQPQGIIGTSGLGSVAGGTNGLAPTWAHIVALETAVAVADADVGSINYLTNPKVRGKLKTTEKFATSNGMAIWEPGNTLNGYGVGVTNVVSSTLTKGGSGAVCSAIIYGNFQDLIIAGWGGVDVERVTDRANAIAGLTSIVVTLFYSSVVQRAASFAAMLDALTT